MLEAAQPAVGEASRGVHWEAFDLACGLVQCKDGVLTFDQALKLSVAHSIQGSN